MASKNLSSTTLLFLLLLFAALAAGVPCEQPKTKPAPAIPKIKPSPAAPKKGPEIPKIIRPPAASSPAVQPAYCPKNTVKFGACSNIVGVGSVIGVPVSSKCCALVSGLTDAEAAACFCSAIKANVLGTNLDIPVSFSLLLSSCQKSVPTGYQCK